MKIREYYATHKARRHMLDKHGVEWPEVWEVLEQDPELRRARPGVGGEKRYYLDGHTAGGRQLRIIVALEPPNTARVVTAYEI